MSQSVTQQGVKHVRLNRCLDGGRHKDLFLRDLSRLHLLDVFESSGLNSGLSAIRASMKAVS
jgi:hypothetical protein